MQRLVRKNDELGQELEWARRELVSAHGALTLAQQALAEQLHDKSEGWEGCEKRLRSMQAERNQYRRKAEELTAQLAREIAEHREAYARPRQKAPPLPPSLPSSPPLA